MDGFVRILSRIEVQVVLVLINLPSLVTTLARVDYSWQKQIRDLDWLNRAKVCLQKLF